MKREFSIRRLLKRTATFVTAGAIPLCMHGPSKAQQGKPSEYQVKAAYLYNFGRYVNWPAKALEQSSDFSICVLGHDPFGSALESMVSGKALDSKPVVIRQIARPEDAAKCRILFVQSGKSSDLQGILPTLKQFSVLTVSDMPGFSDHGGMIQFVLEDDRVRFEVNLTSTESAGLTMSSELLKVASSIKGHPHSGAGN